jgi:DNA polymerase-3 subunit gamma/tau
VVEIDAASNRGVDDARDLRERAMYAPTDHERFKVYIIDEAHMLTREAWNALLKILEEPPPRVIFIFATTEPEKIQQAAPPILSRCQRFDFRRMNVAGIVDRLRQVLAREGIEIDDDALVPIARRADGGMRDALSLLDQVLSFASDRRVVAEDVRQVLGLVGEELYLELFEIVADRRYAEVFRFTERLLDEGYDLSEFHRGLADAIRNLLIAKLDGAMNGEVRDDLRDLYISSAERFSVGDLIRMLAQVSEFDTEGRFRKSSSPRILLEALLLRFTHLDRTIEIEELLRAASTGSGDSAGARSALSAPEPVARPRATPESGHERRQVQAAPEGRADRAGTGSSDSGAMEQPRGSVPQVAPPHDPEPRGAAPLPPEGQAVPPATETETRRGLSPLAAFQEVLRDGTEVPPGLGFFLKAATLSEGEGGTLILEMPAGPGLERLNTEAAAHRQLESALARRLGRPATLQIRAAGGEGGGTEPPRRFTPEQLRSDRLEKMSTEEPLLGRAVQEWDLEWLD